MPKSSSTQRKHTGQYHHGDLRAALISTGLELIGKKGVGALTLREIGRRLGVSRMAAYRHFQDKADLLAAISEAGFTLFGDALQTAKKRAAPSAFAQLHAMAVAYVRFAAEHPSYYEVMFRWAQEAGTRERAASQAGARAFGILEETIRQGQDAGELRKGDSVLLARIVWSQVHGISMLRLAPDLRSQGPGRRFLELSSEILQDGLTAGKGLRNRPNLRHPRL
jgi:AcrR family transcriptional regulator